METTSTKVIESNTPCREGEREGGGREREGEERKLKHGRDHINTMYT
jgi:hypothetical protein